MELGTGALAKGEKTVKSHRRQEVPDSHDRLCLEGKRHIEEEEEMIHSPFQMWQHMLVRDSLGGKNPGSEHIECSGVGKLHRKCNSYLLTCKSK